MKLIDSSAWIEYYRKEGNKHYKACISDAIQSNTAAVNGIIQLEILVFTKTKREYDKIFSDFSALHNLDLNDIVFQKASEIGFDLRRRGITIPAVDLIIASSAMVSDCELIHLDKHFASISEYYPLRIENCLNKWS